MTVNYRRSVNGSNDQLGRHYISDSLTPWWGYWTGGAGGLVIAYDNLPIGDAIARIYKINLLADDNVSFVFNSSQNIENMVLDVYLKCSSNIFLYVSRQAYASWTTEYVAHGSLGITANWARYKIMMARNSAGGVYGWNTYVGIKASPNIILNQGKAIVFYNAAGGPNTLEICGMTLRGQ